MGGGSVAPVFVFVKGAAYRKRFDFYGYGRQMADRELPKQIGIAVQQHIERLRAKR